MGTVQRIAKELDIPYAIEPLEPVLIRIDVDDPILEGMPGFSIPSVVRQFPVVGKDGRLKMRVEARGSITHELLWHSEYDQLANGDPS